MVSRGPGTTRLKITFHFVGTDAAFCTGIFINLISKLNYCHTYQVDISSIILILKSVEFTDVFSLSPDCNSKQLMSRARQIFFIKKMHVRIKLSYYSILLTHADGY